MAIQPIPAGLWKINGSSIVQAPTYNDAELFSMNGTVVAANAPQLAGDYSNIFFNNPSYGGDSGLATYATELSIGNAVLLNNLNSSTDYNITHTSPAYMPSQASPSQGTNSTGGSNATNPAAAGSSANNTSSSTNTAHGAYGGFGGLTNPGYSTNSTNGTTPSYGISLSGANGSTNNTSSNNTANNGWNIGMGQFSPAGTNRGKLTAPNDDDIQGKINSRIALIEKYCDKYGKTVDIAELRTECSKNPEDGLKKCDDILNKNFDQNKLKKLVTKEYEKYNESKLEAGKQVSEQWVEEISKSGLDRAQLSTAGVTKDTVLDVVGTFMTNKKVHAGRVSMEQVFEKPEIAAQLIDTLKARADEDLTDKNIDDDTKNNITVLIGSLRDNYEKYQESIKDDNKHNDLGFNEVRNKLVHSFMMLEGILREREAARNDKIAAKHYGLPDDSSIKFTQQTDRYKEEQNSYNNRKHLSTSIR